MQDFLDDLGRRLEQVAAAEAPSPNRQRSPRNFRRRRPAVLGGITAALAAIVAAFTMTGTSLADLPILGTETQNAAHLEDQAETAKAAGVDFSKAHVFGTPGGPGYALLNERTKTMCLVVPDPSAPGTFGQSCEPVDEVERDGMRADVVGVSGEGQNGTALTVFVLPEGADDPQVVIEGRRSTPDLESGIAVIQTPTGGTLSWSVDGKRRQTRLAAALKTTSMAFACPDGRQVVASAPPSGLTAAEQRRHFADQRRKLCR